MSLLSLVLAQAVAAAPMQPPADWSMLADLPLTRGFPDTDELSGFVRDEVAAGRCVAPAAEADGTVRLTVDMAVMVDRAGVVRRIVPRAINCPTVEQYAVGLVVSYVRGYLAPPGDAAGWFRERVTFAWK